MTERPRTLGELRAADYPDRTVKQELRGNLLARLGDGQPLFPGVVGFDDSVLPALERGILAGHDLILLGERGQAKTRLVRAMVNLLDEFVPAIAGTETNDHPYRPISAHVRSIELDPDLVKVAIASLPAGRRTRRNSSSARSTCGKKKSPNAQITTSNECS